MAKFKQRLLDEGGGKTAEEKGYEKAVRDFLAGGINAQIPENRKYADAARAEARKFVNAGATPAQFKQKSVQLTAPVKSMKKDRLRTIIGGSYNPDLQYQETYGDNKEFKTGVLGKNTKEAQNSLSADTHNNNILWYLTNRYQGTFDDPDSENYGLSDDYVRTQNKMYSMQADAANQSVDEYERGILGDHTFRPEEYKMIEDYITGRFGDNVSREEMSAYEPTDKDLKDLLNYMITPDDTGMSFWALNQSDETMRYLMQNQNNPEVMDYLRNLWKNNSGTESMYDIVRGGRAYADKYQQMAQYGMDQLEMNQNYDEFVLNNIGLYSDRGYSSEYDPEFTHYTSDYSVPVDVRTAYEQVNWDAHDQYKAEVYQIVDERDPISGRGNPYATMMPWEIKEFNERVAYGKESGDYEPAREFLSGLKETGLRHRELSHTEDLNKNFADRHPLFATLWSEVKNVANVPVETVASVFAMLGNKEASRSDFWAWDARRDFRTITGRVGEDITEQFGEAAGYAYEVGLNVLDNTVRRYLVSLIPGAGPALATVVAGVESYANTFADMKIENASDLQAFFAAIADASGESLQELIPAELHFGGKFENSYLAHIIRSMVSEFGEEFIGAWGQPYIDYLSDMIMYKLEGKDISELKNPLYQDTLDRWDGQLEGQIDQTYNADNMQAWAEEFKEAEKYAKEKRSVDYLMQGISGALSGAASAVAVSGAGYLNDVKSGEQIQNTEGVTEDLILMGLDSKDEGTRQLAEKLSDQEKVKDAKIKKQLLGRLEREVMNEQGDAAWDQRKRELIGNLIGEDPQTVTQREKVVNDAAAMLGDEKEANAFKAAYSISGAMNVRNFMMGWIAQVDAAQNGTGIEKGMQSVVDQLPQTVRAMAIDFGQNKSKIVNEMLEEPADIKGNMRVTLDTIRQQKGGNGVTMKVAEGTKMNKSQAAQVVLVDALAKRWGINVSVVSGEEFGAQGEWSGRNNITVSLNATQGLVSQVFGHETWHMLKSESRNNNDTRRIYENLVTLMTWVLNQDESYDLEGRIQQKMDSYKRSVGQNLSREDALEEILSEESGAILVRAINDGTLAEAIVQNDMDDSIIGKIKQYAKKVMKVINDALVKLGVKNPEVKAVLNAELEMVKGIYAGIDDLAVKVKALREARGEVRVEESDALPKYSVKQAAQKYIDAKEEENKWRQEYQTIKNSSEYKNLINEAINSSGEEMKQLLNKIKEYEETSGLSKAKKMMEQAEKKLKQAHRIYDEEYTKEQLEKEKIAIQKSGLTEKEWRVKQAVNEFGRTTNFRQAGYMTPDGKLLNFTGEKGKHYGHRGQDHRAIGSIYADKEGWKAMVSFMNDGNIRVMAETPGIDISTNTPLTAEQYAGIKKMAEQFAREQYFNVDFTDEKGDNVGSIEYEGRINPSRIVNDIKSYYQTGVVPGQSELSKFRYSIKDSAYMDAVEKGNIEKAQDIMLETAGKAGYTVRAYHGTGRADRVGNVFLPERATSGPMAYFTSNKTIAQSYAKNKIDTSLSYLEYDANDYHEQFRVTDQDGNGTKSIYDLWYRLKAKDRIHIAEAARHVTFDEDEETIFYDPSATQGTGGFSYQLKDAKGNVIKALFDHWLDSGNLYNDENKFLQVLNLSGVTQAVKNAGYDEIKYYNPEERHEKVYDVLLKINNPFDAAQDVNEDFVRGFREFAETYNEEEDLAKNANADPWDKHSVSAEMFADRMERDIQNGTSTAWTSIPDVATEYIKSLGYDGIKDVGGKNGGDEHVVWIPFSSEQVKSAQVISYDDNGNVIPLSERFNDKKTDIRYSIKDGIELNGFQYALDYGRIQQFKDDVNENQGEINNELQKYGSTVIESRSDNGTTFMCVSLDEQNRKVVKSAYKLDFIQLKDEPNRESLIKKIENIVKIGVRNNENIHDLFRNIIGYDGETLLERYDRRTNGYVALHKERRQGVVYKYGKKNNGRGRTRIELQRHDELADGSIHYAGQNREIEFIKQKNESKKSIKQQPVAGNDVRSLIEENRQLKDALSKTLQYLNASGSTVDRSDVDKLAKRIKREFHFTQDARILADDLQRAFNVIMNAADSTEMNTGMQMLSNIAREGLESSSVADREMYDQYKEFRDSMRLNRWELTERQWQEGVNAFGSEQAFRRAMFGKWNVVKQNGSKLDDNWSELVGQYSGLIKPDVNEGDMVSAIIEALDNTAIQYVNPYKMNIDQYANDLALNLVEQMSSMKINLPTSNALKEANDANRVLVQENERLTDELRRKGTSEKRAEEAWSTLKSTNAVLQERIQSVRKQVEDRNKLVQGRAQIVRQANQLNRKLNNFSKTGFVPENMREAVQNLLDSIGVTKEGNGTGKLTRDVLIAAKNAYMQLQPSAQNQDEYSQKVNAFFNGDLADDFDKLIDYLTKYANGKDYRDVTIGRMSGDLVESLKNIVAGYTAAIVNEDRIFFARRSESIAEVAGMMQEKARSRKEHKSMSVLGEHFSRALNRGLLKPVSVFHMFKGTAFEDVFRVIRDAENKHIRNVTQATEFFENAIEKYGMQESINKDATSKGRESKKVSFEIGDDTIGRSTIRLTDQEIMMIYATNKREQIVGTQHMLQGGIKLRTTGRGQSLQVYRVTQKDIDKIVNTLTDNQKEYVDYMVHYLTSTGGRWGNEVTRELYGVDKYTESYYIPFSVDRNAVNQEPGTERDQRLRSASHTKSIVVGAKNAVNIDSFTETWAGHIERMSDFNAFTLPIENLVRLMNVKGMRDALNWGYGKEVTDYIHAFLSRLNGNSKREMGGSWINTMIGKAKGASVTFNASVAIQQGGAGVRAMSEIGPQYYIPGMMKGLNFGKEFAEAQKYAQVAVLKDWGYFDTQMTRGMYQRHQDTLQSKINDIGGYLAGKGDELNWGQTWAAVKLEQEAQWNKSGKNARENGEYTEDFLKACGERFTEVIDKTQVVDSIMQRAEWATEKGLMSKYMAFMSEPITMYNMLYRAVWDLNDARVNGGNVNAAAKKLVRTNLAIILCSALTAALKSVVSALRDRDNEKKEKYENGKTIITGVRGYGDKWLDSYGDNFLDNMLGVTTIFGNMFDAAGSSTSSNDLSNQFLTNLMRTGKEFMKLFEVDENGDPKNPVDAYKIIYYASQMASSLTGVGFGSATRDINSIIQTTKERLTQDEMAGTAWDINEPFDKRVKAAEKNYVYNKDAKGRGDQRKVKTEIYKELMLAGYYLDGETFGDNFNAAAEAAMRGGATQTSIVSGFKSAFAGDQGKIVEAAQALVDNDLTTATRLMKEVEAGGIGAQAVEAMVKTEYNRLTNTDEEKDNGTVQGAVKKLTDDEIKTSLLKTVVKDKAEAGTMSTDQAVSYMVKSGFAETEKDAYASLNGGSSYQKLYDGITANRSEDINAAVREMVKYGYELKSIQKQIKSKYSSKYLALPTGAEKTRMKDALIKALKACGLTADQANKEINGWKPSKKKKS